MLSKKASGNTDLQSACYVKMCLATLIDKVRVTQKKMCLATLTSKGRVM